MNIFEFEGIQISVPKYWCDITDDLGPGSVPTLARGENARGALQFSMAKYKGGKNPELNPESLTELLIEFSSKQDLSSPKDIQKFKGAGVIGIQGDFFSSEQFLRVWLVTNGRDVIFITYCVVGNLKSDFSEELIEAESIVKAIVL